MSGMLVTDPWEVCRAREAMGCLEDVFSAVVPSLFEPNEELKKNMRKKLNEETLPTKLKYLNTLIEQNGNTGYMTNNKLCPCDLVLYTLVAWLRYPSADMLVLEGIDGEKLVENLNGINKCYDTINTNPKVVEWNKNNNNK
eukprot:GHVR01013201.1.p1 GENE.GHVR01013201.1~~GHVR01013201.1.p1  ORF type:complete len:141 (+),score=42.14 GHVR01013201.1:314-736(+)